MDHIGILSLNPQGTETPSNVVFNSDGYTVTYQWVEARAAIIKDWITEYITLPGLGYGSGADGSRLGALSADHTLFAIARFYTSSSIIELHRLVPTQNHLDCKAFLGKPVLIISVPPEGGENYGLFFSSDNTWLKLEKTDRTYYYKLPIHYLLGRLTVKQIAYIRVLQVNGINGITAKRILGQRGLEFFHKLLNCSVLESFPDAEKSLLKYCMHESMNDLRNTRSSFLRTLHYQKIEDARKCLAYLVKEELPYVRTELASIQDTRLAKKICKAMLTKLRKAEPTLDLAHYDYSYNKEPDFAEKIHFCLSAVCNLYLASLEKLGYYGLKRELTDLICDALAHRKAY